LPLNAPRPQLDLEGRASKGEGMEGKEGKERGKGWKGWKGMQ